jgi:hypothetical protein
MGAGVGYEYSDVIGSAMANGLVNEIAVPHVRGTVLLERRLFGRLYLLAEPEFGYVRHVLDPEEGQTSVPGAEPTVVTTFAAVAGVRWVANPGDVVELGMTHLLEARWGWLTANGTRSRPGGLEPVDTHITGRLQGVGLSTGLVGERRLLPQLWVRVHLVFLRAAYAALSVHYQDVDGRRFTRNGESSGVSLTLDPRLELRLSW